MSLMRLTQRSYSQPQYTNHEEIECQASNEPDLTITDTESMVRDSLDAGEMGDTSALREGSRRGFTYGDLFWDARWEDDMDLYDDLDDWCWEGDELLGKESEESMDNSEDNNSTSRDSSGETLPYDG